MAKRGQLQESIEAGKDAIRTLQDSFGAQREEPILEAPSPEASPTAGMVPPVLSQKVRRPMPRTDPELQAMARIDRILAELDGNQQRRVVEWIRDRFGPQPRYGTFCLPGEAGNGPDSPKESTR